MDLTTLLYHKKEDELVYTNFLLHKGVEITQIYNKTLTNWTTKINKQIKQLYKMKQMDVPPFMLHYIHTDGHDKKMEN